MDLGTKRTYYSAGSVPKNRSFTSNLPGVKVFLLFINEALYEDLLIFRDDLGWERVTGMIWYRFLEIIAYATA